ncbi:MAG: hypothetical protein KKA19_04260 [Candidatus Margulisbacteria bacterium]|nr:hypothetical protein [Candidatus Margulisiibacteriota bacterium]
MQIANFASMLVEYCNVQGGFSGTANINITPSFVSSPTADLHLRFDSPCIDSGATDISVTTDIENNLRPLGAGYDMGAYEYTGGFYLIEIKPSSGATIEDLSEKCFFHLKNFYFPSTNLSISVNINGQIYSAPSLDIIDLGGTTSANMYATVNINLDFETTYNVTINASSPSESIQSSFWFATVKADVHNFTKGMLPYARIQTALDAASPNDVIVIVAKSHQENLTWPNTEGLTLRGEDGTTSFTVFLDGNQVSRCVTVPYPVSLTINGLTIQRGQLADHGGGIFVTGSATINIINVIVSKNSTTGVNHGGGIYVLSGGRVNAANCIFFGNTSASKGGAIYNSGTYCENNNTYAGNTSASDGGGFYNQIGLYYGMNNIFWNNSAGGNGNQFFNNSGTINATYTDFGNNGIAGVTFNYDSLDHNITENPQFVDLAGGNLRLGDDSPCAEVGSSFLYIQIDSDIEGNVRPRGNKYDLGAFEAVRTATNTIDYAELKPGEKPLAYPTVFNPDEGDVYLFFNLTAEQANKNNIKLKIYNLSGENIWEFEPDVQTGSNKITWSGQDIFGNRLSNGVYVFYVVSGRHVVGKGKVVIMR